MKRDEDIRVRRSGRTTRLIDRYIQELFIKGTTTVIDHYDLSQEGTERLMKTILRRLHAEHRLSRNDMEFYGRTVITLPEWKEAFSRFGDRTAMLSEDQWVDYYASIASVYRTDFNIWRENIDKIPKWVKRLLNYFYKTDF